jgi:hypothetical protein
VKMTFGRAVLVGRWFALGLLFLVLFWGYAMFWFPMMTVALLLTSVIAFDGLKEFRQLHITTDRSVVFLLLVSMTLMLPAAMAKSPASVLHYANGIVSILAAFVLTKDIKNLKRALKFTLITSQLIILGYLLQTGYMVSPLDFMLKSGSSNV